MHPRRILLIGALLASVLVVAVLLVRPDAADILYVNGVIHTLDPEHPAATAVALRDGRIVAVGTDADLLDGVRPDTVIDLAGATVVPGLIDAHAHVEGLGALLATLNLAGTSSVSEIQHLVRSAVQGLPPGAWVRGRGWDQNRWEEPDFPHRSSLDSVAGEHPVILVRIDGHAAWVSSSVLEQAGIVAGTPDPDGGRILRDAAGLPTGVLIDNAIGLLDPVIPRPGPEERERFVESALQECARYGLTAVHDMGVDREGVEIYKKLGAAGRLPIRVYIALEAPGPAWEHYREHGPEIDLFGGMVTIRAIKLYADGALGSRGAALIEPYADDPTNRGLTLASHEDLTRLSEEALGAGFQVCTHAIGDRANSMVLDAYADAFNSAGDNALNARFRVEHAQIVHPDDITRFAALGVLPSMQPTHCTSDMYWADERLGPVRERHAYAWRSFIDAGSIIPGGSDFPVESPDPLLGLYAAITRQDLQGWPADGWHPEQRMSREEALKAFTTWAASAAFQEREKARIAPGYVADLTVLSADPLRIPAAEIPAMIVLRTVVAGREIHRSH